MNKKKMSILLSILMLLGSAPVKINATEPTVKLTNLKYKYNVQRQIDVFQILDNPRRGVKLAPETINIEIRSEEEIPQQHLNELATAEYGYRIDNGNDPYVSDTTNAVYLDEYRDVIDRIRSNSLGGGVSPLYIKTIYTSEVVAHSNSNFTKRLKNSIGKVNFKYAPPVNGSTIDAVYRRITLFHNIKKGNTLKFVYDSLPFNYELEVPASFQNQIKSDYITNSKLVAHATGAVSKCIKFTHPEGYIVDLTDIKDRETYKVELITDKITQVCSRGMYYNGTYNGDLYVGKPSLDYINAPDTFENPLQLRLITQEEYKKQSDIQVKVLQQQIEELKRQTQEAINAKAALASENSKIEQRKQSLEAEYQRLIETTTQRKKELEAEKERLIEESKQHKKDLEAEKERLVEESKQKKKALEDEYQGLVQASNQRKKTLEEEYKALLNEVNKQKQELLLQQEQLKNKKQNLEQQKTEFEEQQKAWNTEYQKQKAEAQAKQKEAQQREESAVAKVAEAEEKLRLAKLTDSSNTEKLLELGAQLEKAKQDQLKAREEYLSYNQKLADLNKQYEDIRKNREETEKALNTATEKLNEAIKKSTELQSKEESLKVKEKNLEIKQKDLANLQKQKEENDAKRKELENLEKELKELENKVKPAPQPAPTPVPVPQPTPQAPQSQPQSSGGSGGGGGSSLSNNDRTSERDRDQDRNKNITLISQPTQKEKESSYKEFNVAEVTEKTAIEYVNKAGIMVGDKLGRFNENDTLTRAQVAQILSNKNKLKDSPASENINYKDVTRSSWFYKAVKNTVNNNLFTGTSQDTFSPTKDITLGEFARVLDSQYNTVSMADKIKTTTDSKVINKAEWNSKEVNALEKLNILEPMKLVDAKKPITRGQVARMIYVLDNISVNNKGQVVAQKPKQAQGSAQGSAPNTAQGSMQSSTQSSGILNRISVHVPNKEIQDKMKVQ